jgi:glycerol-3-phosphate acyltransferase PlsY
MIPLTIAMLIGLPFLAYLLGSIPWGIIVARIFTSKDIRRQGSGNIGATNVLRIAGAKAGIVVLSADLLKGVLPVLFAVQLVNTSTAWGQIYVSLAALAAFGGHLYPLYLGLKDGGKGVATAFGCILVLSPVTAFITVLVFILMVCMTSRVSVGSLSGAAALPLILWKTTGSWVLVLCAVTISVFIFLRHRENIRRLINGTESKIWKT